ncbi:MAG TPA: TetR/AcrR family transcriptional regulator [Spirochaetota bacterium]
MQNDKSTKDVILDVAENLILRHGYTNFSYDDIAKIVKIRKASIHYHYPKKEDLGLAFIDRIMNKIREYGMTQERSAAKEKIESVFEMFMKLSDGNKRICPFDVMSAEYENLPKKLQKKVVLFFSSFDEYIVGIIRSGIGEGLFKKDIDPLRVSKLIINSLSYSLKLARIYNDSSQITMICEEIRDILYK